MYPLSFVVEVSKQQNVLFHSNFLVFFYTYKKDKIQIYQTRYECKSDLSQGLLWQVFGLYILTFTDFILYKCCPKILWGVAVFYKHTFMQCFIIVARSFIPFFLFSLFDTKNVIKMYSSFNICPVYESDLIYFFETLSCLGVCDPHINVVCPLDYYWNYKSHRPSNQRHLAWILNINKSGKQL